MNQKLTIEEVFGILPVDDEEVETDRTNDLGNITNPNWSGKLKKFSLGLHNSEATILSNLISKKVNNGIGGLSSFLDHMLMSQQQIFDFMLRVIDRILNKERK